MLVWSSEEGTAGAVAGDSVGFVFGIHAWFVCAKGPCTKPAALHKVFVNDEDVEVGSKLSAEYYLIVGIVNLY